MWIKPAADPVATAIPSEWESRLSPSERQQLALAMQIRAPVWTLSFSPSEANAARGITISTVRERLGAINRQRFLDELAW